VRAVSRRLERQHGEFQPKQRRDPLDELIMTVLSQHTSDLNSSRAFASLRNRFATWAEVLAAPVDEVAGAIRSGGIAEIKARRIQAILAEIQHREGALDLARLQTLLDAEVDGYLRSLPGVGPKTAACVLLFSLGRAAFPVDTHVHRVAVRLGWVGEAAGAESAHDELESIVPPDLRYALHLGLVRHGRTICRSRHPLCSSCELFDLCPSGPELLGSGAGR